MMYSVAINGSSSIICLLMRFSYTTIPSIILFQIRRMASMAKNACGMVSLLLAESSKVLSNHCVEATIAELDDKDITNFANAPILSERIGLSLYAIAEEPIWFFSKGSSISRSEEHTSELQSRENLVCRLLLEKKK